jgi:hypothetical protein
MRSVLRLTRKLALAPVNRLRYTTSTTEANLEDITCARRGSSPSDGERVILPNGDVYVNPIVVLTAHPQRRVKFSVAIGYADSVEKAREVIHHVLKTTEGVRAGSSGVPY